MQALQNRLQQLENATGSDIWEILKASEPELRQDLQSLNTQKEEKERKARQALEALKSKKAELQNLKKEVESLRNEYKDHIKSVETSLNASGLNMKQIVHVFEKVMEDSLSEKKKAILETIETADISTKKSINDLREPVKIVLSLLKDQNQSQLRLLVQKELQEFYTSAVEIFRSNLWTEFQKQGIPVKKLQETANFSEFLQKITEIFNFSCDLDELLIGNHEKSIDNLIMASFGQLSNICMDMIENERNGKEDDSDFEWILISAHKWSKHLNEVIEIAVEKTKIDKKLKEKREVGLKFNEKFVEFIAAITKKFVRKNVKDPMIFSKLAVLLRRFEETCDFDLMEKDLFEPLYEPEFMSKWILLEVEMFTIQVNQILADPNCFDPLPAIFIGNSSNGNQWASEVTCYFEQWIQRIDKDISSFGNSQIQCVFYESLHALMIELCSRIHVLANKLYSKPSWSNDVYLVMNSIWELRRIVQTLTVTWPITSFEIEKTFGKEWERLSGMIVEYLMDIVDNMDRQIRSTYSSENKRQTINGTFHHILKCLNNVTIKASQPSRSPLLNALTQELFKNLQLRFDKWQNSCSVEILGCLYTQIYSNLLPQLDSLENQQKNGWKRENGTRSEICRLDALMKMAANCDPSGELVRISFRSIDEEQVIKLLGELGIHSTSDHTFQDYQILAENWQKIKDKGYEYGNY